MGDLIPFRRKKKPKTWTRPDDYGHVLPTSAWSGRTAGKTLKQRLQIWILPALFVAIFAWTYWSSMPEKATAPDARSLRIDPPVTACGSGNAPTCVVDGDTIKVGQRTVRLIGIDAPEISPPRCVEEAAKGLKARDRLVELANQGPFFLTGAGARDEYGRELFDLVRVRPDKSLQSFAKDLTDGGFARVYTGGARQPWC